MDMAVLIWKDVKLNVYNIFFGYKLHGDKCYFDLKGVQENGKQVSFTS